MRLLGPRDPKNKPKIRSLSRLKSPAAAASQSPVKRGKSMPSAPLHNGEPPASFLTGKNLKRSENRPLQSVAAPPAAGAVQVGGRSGPWPISHGLFVGAWKKSACVPQ